MTFDIKRKFRLNYAKAEDAPALKGRFAFMGEKANQLSPKELDEVKREIEIWRHDLTEYITKEQDCFDRIKVTGVLDSNGSLMPGSVKFYSEGPIGGDFSLIDLSKIPTPQAVERDAYTSISNTIKEVNTQKYVFSMAVYDRIKARDYANTWTSNTTQVCRSGSSTVQDHTKYNLSAYSTWYQCNDCANYVSQAVNAGGISRYNVSGGWYPYSSCWINCDRAHIIL